MRFPMWILAFLCAAVGIGASPFIEFVLRPAAGCAASLEHYIVPMLAGVQTGPAMVRVDFLGSWNPIMWLILLLVVTLAVCIFSCGAPAREVEALADGDIEDVQVLPEHTKYEPFFSGEESH